MKTEPSTLCILEENLQFISKSSAVIYLMLFIVGMALVIHYYKQGQKKDQYASLVYAIFMLLFGSYLGFTANGAEQSSRNAEVIFQILLVGYGLLVSFYDFKIVEKNGVKKFGYLGVASVLTFTATFGGEFFRNRYDDERKDIIEENKRTKLKATYQLGQQQILVQNDSIRTEIEVLDSVLSHANDSLEKVKVTVKIIRRIAEINRGLNIYNRKLMDKADSFQGIISEQVGHNQDSIYGGFAFLKRQNQSLQNDQMDTLNYYNGILRDSIRFYADSNLNAQREHTKSIHDLDTSIDNVRNMLDPYLTLDTMASLFRNYQADVNVDQIFSEILVLMYAQPDSITRLGMIRKIEAYQNDRPNYLAAD